MAQPHGLLGGCLCKALLSWRKPKNVAKRKKNTWRRKPLQYRKVNKIKKKQHTQKSWWPMRHPRTSYPLGRAIEHWANNWPDLWALEKKPRRNYRGTVWFPNINLVFAILKTDRRVLPCRMPSCLYCWASKYSRRNMRVCCHAPWIWDIRDFMEM